MAQDKLQSQDEQEIQFKKRARRRLVGSVALVLFMIVALPMVLEDRSAQTPKAPVAISIPSQDAEAFVPKVEPVAPPPEVQVQPEPVQAAPEPLAAEPEPAPVIEEKPKQEVSKKEAEAKPAKAESKSEPVKAPKKEEKKPTSEKVSGNYFIQIGVFSDPEKVKQMQAKLSGAGLKSNVELIETAKGQKSRLRVGPYNSKSDAEDKLAKVKSLGYSDARVGSN
jgi:DedD protein